MYSILQHSILLNTRQCLKLISISFIEIKPYLRPFKINKTYPKLTKSIPNMTNQFEFKHIGISGSLMKLYFIYFY